MKKVILVLIASTFVILQAQSVNFDFFGADKRGIYNSTTLNQDIKKESGFNFKISSIILVESSSADNKNFKAQNKVFDMSSELFENYASLQVTSITDVSETSGYHTSIGTAKRLNPEDKDFKITILTPKGKVINSFTKVINKEEFEKILKSIK